MITLIAKHSESHAPKCASQVRQVLRRVRAINKTREMMVADADRRKTLADGNRLSLKLEGILSPNDSPPLNRRHIRRLRFECRQER